MTDKQKKPKQRKPNVGSDSTVGSKTRWWQVGLYAATGGIFVLLVLFLAVRLLQGQFVPGVAISALVIGGVTWALVTSSDKSTVNPGGIVIGTSEPALTSFVESVALAVGAPGVDDIHLVVEPRLTVVEETRFFGLQHWRRSLIVGLPFLHTMTKDELAALTAHHLGHFADGHVHEGVRSMRALRAGSHLIQIERSSALNGVFGSYGRKMSRSVGGVGVAQETGAERAAVDAFGTSAMLSGLAKLDDVESAWDQMLRHYVVPALQNGAHPKDLFTGFEALVLSSERIQERAGDVERRKNADGVEFDPHNTPGQRAAMVSQWPSIAGSTQFDDGDALGHTLLDPDAKSAEIVIGTWAHKLMDSQTEPRSWQELNDDVYSAASHKLAQRGFDEVDLDPSDWFDQVLEWTNEHWSELDEMLSGVKSLKRLEPSERRASWTAALVTEAAAATSSYRWQPNWDGPPMLVSSNGEPFDPEPVAERIIRGESAQARTEFDRLTAAESSSN